jgi:hypothetical protein
MAELSSSSDSDDEYETDIGEQYDALLSQIEHLATLIETTETALHKLQRPILSLSTQQLGDLAFLESSPFRKQAFLVRMDPRGDRRPFHEICAELREYLFHNAAVTSDGSITITPLLRSQLRFKPRQKTTTYSEVLGLLVYGVV